MPRSRKLENQTASSSKKMKTESSQPEVEVIDLEKAPSSFNQDLLRCPVCGQFPRKEVYQCNAGHSICATCLTKLRKCPLCRGLYKKVRNYMAEGLLDSMKFECSWKEFGCKVTQLARKDLTSHESQCEFNPNAIKFCFWFGRLPCKNKFCPVSTQDPVEMNNFLNHLKSTHDFTVRDVKPRESFIIHFKYDLSGGVYIPGNFGDRGRGSWLWRTILRFSSTQTTQGQGRHQLYMALCRFEEVNGQDVFLIKVVRLIDENQAKMTISLCLTEPEKVGPPKPQMPEMNWTVQPQGIRELKGFWVKDDDLSSYLMIPVAFLESYKTEEGLPIEFSFP